MTVMSETLRPATFLVDTMRATVFHGPGDIRVESVPKPRSGVGEAVVRVTTTTICGTDIHILKGEYPVRPGLIIGHEPVGVIDEGTVAGQRFTWEGTVGGETVMTVRVNWLMGSEALDPAWTLGEQRFEVALDAEPPVSCTFHGLHPPVVGEQPEIGLIAPAMHCVNAIPYVCRAEPGIKTYLDLPLLAGRAALR